MAIENSETLTRYWLGELSEEERERLEQKYFADHQVWEALNTAEQELIDLYVRGRLSPPQRERFETYYLNSPRKRERLEFARMLLSAEAREQWEAGVTASPARTRWREFRDFFALNWRPAVKLTLAGATAAAAAALVFLALHKQKQQEAKQHFPQAGSGQIAYSPTPQPSVPENSPNNSEETAARLGHDLTTTSIVLLPGMVRDASGAQRVHRLMISDATETVWLHLALEENAYPHYEADIRTAEGKQIKHFDALKSHQTKRDGEVVSLKLPAQSLAKGDYIVKLFGRPATGQAEEVDAYAFTVLR